MRLRWMIPFALAAIATGCSPSRFSVDGRKLAPPALQEDFAVFRGALEELHPSLYWFTPKDSMDAVFEQTRARLEDTLSERAFRTLLARVVAAIRCGHTAVNYSKAFSRYLDTAIIPVFPLSFKLLSDTLVVTANLHRRDRLLTRGTIVTAINGVPAARLIDTLLQHTTGDGYAQSGRYQSLSNYGHFGALYRNLWSLPDSLDIDYLDSTGRTARVRVGAYIPLRKEKQSPDSIAARRERRRKNLIATDFSRSLQIDTVLSSGYMQVNSFARGTGLRGYIRRSFRNLSKLNTRHLVIDLRSNGGGDAAHAIRMIQYLSDHPFVVADSLYTTRRSTRYRDHIRFQPLYWLMTTLITKKQSDGLFHFGYFERHRFKPLRKHHFDGNIYLLTGGNSFSATTLLVQELKGQRNVTIIGEETGGGAYGNTAWILPTLTLPHSRLRVTIPRFRFVMRRDLIAEGRGVQPDVCIAPSAADIRRGADVKLEYTRYMIMMQQ